MNKTCKQCGKEYEAKRATSQYCSPKCRKLAFQNDSVLSVPGESQNAKPANYGQADCQCMHCQQNRRSKNPLIINHGPYKRMAELLPNEVNRVTLPGDIDYKGVCNVQ